MAVNSLKAWRRIADANKLRAIELPERFVLI
jgi:hypothetical protein